VTVGRKVNHEFRDPVHQFISVTTDERLVVDSRACQRLRHVSQLAMSSLIYPGATHKRFEHSLGVMHLAGEAFDVLTRRENLRESVRDVVPELEEPDKFGYWRSVVRMAALCHDLGHLPFSHAAEHDVLPPGTSHETLSSQLILSDEMREIFNRMVPPIHPEVVAKIAVGPKSGDSFTVWEALLTEIITGDAFGVDRMDYLLRDSLHAGVAYGRFDQHRLIQTLRFLPPVSDPSESEGASQAPGIGIESGGLHAAEGLLLARYFMFAQVYFHPIRVIYDIHLIDFLKLWLDNGVYSVDLESHLNMTDNEVLAAMRAATLDTQHPAHDPAARILNRTHFKALYQRSAADLELTPEPGKAVFAWAQAQYGEDAVRHRSPNKSVGAFEFPVSMPDGSVASSTAVSETLRHLPSNSLDFVFIDPEKVDDARKRLRAERESILTARLVLDDDDETQPEKVS
jgi:HD superfamily phosphohydrolase